MKIIEKINKKARDIFNEKQPVIAFTGDSVTQGCFEIYVKEKGIIETVFDSKESYTNKVKSILSILYPSSNVTIINAGLSGNKADVGYARLKEDVIDYNPDLTVVCYGLNDAFKRDTGIECYRESLRNIFRDLKAAGSEVIFMTPNMCTDRVDYSFKEPEEKDIAQSVVDMVTLGWLDRYIDTAKQVCIEENIPVCDCYEIWKKMKNGGVDITSVLSNKINHPIKELHWIFAYELVKMMFKS